MNRLKKIITNFLLINLTILVNQEAYGFSSISFGGFQGYQVVSQKESLYKTNSTLASLPTIGLQFQFQTTLSAQVGFRFKYEAINVKFQTPPEGFLSTETFQTTSIGIEIPFQHNLHWQSFVKIAKKERILFNIDQTLRFNLYKSTAMDYGLGLNYDSQNLGGLVYGTGASISLLNFQSKDINNIPASHLGTDFEIRAKIGWIYEIGWGHIFRAIYSTFYMPNNIDKNTGKEIKFFGEIIKSF